MFWNENHAPSWTTHSNHSPCSHMSKVVKNPHVSQNFIFMIGYDWAIFNMVSYKSHPNLLWAVLAIELIVLLCFFSIDYFFTQLYNYMCRNGNHPKKSLYFDYRTTNNPKSTCNHKLIIISLFPLFWRPSTLNLISIFVKKILQAFHNASIQGRVSHQVRSNEIPFDRYKTKQAPFVWIIRQISLCNWQVLYQSSAGTDLIILK